MKRKHFRHENAGEAVYDADRHKSADDRMESLIIVLMCVCAGVDECAWDLQFMLLKG